MASSKKCISKAAYLRWPENIRKNYEFSFNDSGDKVIHALCKVCKLNICKIKERYAGKLVDDVVKYGTEGNNNI